MFVNISHLSALFFYLEDKNKIFTNNSHLSALFFSNFEWKTKLPRRWRLDCNHVWVGTSSTFCRCLPIGTLVPMSVLHNVTYLASNLKQGCQMICISIPKIQLLVHFERKNYANFWNGMMLYFFIFYKTVRKSIIRLVANFFSFWLARSKNLATLV
jgi:hypothetical protein